MTRAPRILRWQSPFDASRCGVEVENLDPGVHRLEALLDRGLGALGVAQPTFILVRIRSRLPEDVGSFIARCSDAFLNARVSVAVDQEALRALDPALLRGRKLGLLLDQVDASTPLSAISDGLVDALRFEHSFIELASRDSRMTGVVDAMLKLAGERGLATLASRQSRLLAHDFKFDYVSELAA